MASFLSHHVCCHFPGSMNLLSKIPLYINILRSLPLTEYILLVFDIFKYVTWYVMWSNSIATIPPNFPTDLSPTVSFYNISLLSATPSIFVPSANILVCLRTLHLRHSSKVMETMVQALFLVFPHLFHTTFPEVLQISLTFIMTLFNYQGIVH